MAVDAELISSEAFNLKFKNYLRDFYVYQFKERGRDFKVKGTKDPNDVNKDVVDGTFYPDAHRLQYALAQSAGVVWSKGTSSDPTTGRAGKKRENKRVECVTIDSRRIADNPFFALYRLCGESATIPGTHFSFFYALLLYFRLGKDVERTACAPLHATQVAELNQYLQELAVTLESEARRHRPRAWDALSEADRQHFATEAIDKFDRSHEGAEAYYTYMVSRRLRLTYADGIFAFAPDTAEYIEKNRLFDAMKSYDIAVDEKQFGNKLQEWTQLGILRVQKQGQRLYYALSNVFLEDFLHEHESLRQRFTDCVSFFSQTAALGEIGSYVLRRLPRLDHRHIRFKHHYIKRALNDYNNADLLYAMRNGLFAYIEYRNAALGDLEYQQILCYPLEIRESVTNGRQYLIYYHPLYRSVSAVRVEFIDSITLGQMSTEAHFAADLERARTLIDHTWGTAFDHFEQGNVKETLTFRRIRVLIACDQNEPFIKRRLKRELRHRATLTEGVDEHGRSYIEVMAQVANPWEMLQWLRSYTTRVMQIDIDGQPFHGFHKDVIRTLEAYVKPIPRSRNNVPSRKGKHLLRDALPTTFTEVKGLRERLFNEIFSIPCEELGELLLRLMQEKVVRKERWVQLKNDYAARFFSDRFSEIVQWETEDKRLDQADRFAQVLTHRDGERVTSVFAWARPTEVDQSHDLIPLTLMERQWLKNMLVHPLSKAFLTAEEIAALEDWLGEVDLFDVNTIVLHDQHSGLEDFYAAPAFSSVMRSLLDAIRTHTTVAIHYQSQYGRQSRYVCAPSYLEYSKRDHCIRLRAVSNKVAKTFNVERILAVTPLPQTFDPTQVEAVIEQRMQDNERELVLFFNETLNVPDRILTEFSCFKKTCVKWGDRRYRMTLCYDTEDRLEILVRLLSYGSLIHVFDDTGDVRHELIARLRRQKELTDSLQWLLTTDRQRGDDPQR